MPPVPPPPRRPPPQPPISSQSTSQSTSQPTHPLAPKGHPPPKRTPPHPNPNPLPVWDDRHHVASGPPPDRPLPSPVISSRPQSKNSINRPMSSQNSSRPSSSQNNSRPSSRENSSSNSNSNSSSNAQPPYMPWLNREAKSGIDNSPPFSHRSKGSSGGGSGGSGGGTHHSSLQSMSKNKHSNNSSYNNNNNNNKHNDNNNDNNDDSENNGGSDKVVRSSMNDILDIKRLAVIHKDKLVLSQSKAISKSKSQSQSQSQSKSKSKMKVQGKAKAKNKSVYNRGLNRAERKDDGERKDEEGKSDAYPDDYDDDDNDNDYDDDGDDGDDGYGILNPPSNLYSNSDSNSSTSKHNSNKLTSLDSSDSDSDSDSSQTDLDLATLQIDTNLINNEDLKTRRRQDNDSDMSCVVEHGQSFIVMDGIEIRTCGLGRFGSNGSVGGNNGGNNNGGSNSRTGITDGAGAGAGGNVDSTNDFLRTIRKTPSTSSSALDTMMPLSILGHGSSGVVRKALHVPSLKLVALKEIGVYEEGKRRGVVRELKGLYGNIVALGEGGRGKANANANSTGTGTGTANSSEGGGNGSGSSPCQHIVSLYDAFLTPLDQTVTLVVEYMDGGSLQDIVDTGGCSSEPVLANISARVLAGLGYLHGKGMIHRDVKPGNLLINHHGNVKIGDLGIVKDLTHSRNSNRNRNMNSNTSSSSSNNGNNNNSSSNNSDDEDEDEDEDEAMQALAETFTGTFTYMSPERIAGMKYGYASDIWSLGLTVMTVAIGKFPYEKAASGGYWSLLQALKDSVPPLLNTLIPPSPSHPPFSAELEDFVRLCMMKDPDDRPTAEELMKHAFVRGVDVTSEPGVNDGFNETLPSSNNNNAEEGEEEGGESGSGSDTARSEMEDISCSIIEYYRTLWAREASLDLSLTVPNFNRTKLRWLGRQIGLELGIVQRKMREVLRVLKGEFEGRGVGGGNGNGGEKESFYNYNYNHNGNGDSRRSMSMRKSGGGSGRSIGSEHK